MEIATTSWPRNNGLASPYGVDPLVLSVCIAYTPPPWSVGSAQGRFLAWPYPTAVTVRPAFLALQGTGIAHILQFMLARSWCGDAR